MHHLGLEPSFSFEIADYPSNGRTAFEFRPSKTPAGLYGPFVKVRTNQGHEWLGQFFGGLGDFTDLFCGPSPNHLCVIAGGQGYVVDVAQPASFRVVPICPVIQVQRVPSSSMLVLVSYTGVAACAPEGFVWKYQNLVDDGLTIDHVDAEQLTMRVQGDEVSPDRLITLDVRTGTEGTDKLP